MEQLAEGLLAKGYEVWWDLQILGGADFSKDIESELKKAKSVIVVWSEAGINSAWVKDEAAAGLNQGKLVPISLDGVEAPMGFRQYQAIQFSEWDGSKEHPAFTALQQSLESQDQTQTPDMRTAEGVSEPPGFSQAVSIGSKFSDPEVGRIGRSFQSSPGVRVTAFLAVLVFLAAGFWLGKGSLVGQSATITRTVEGAVDVSAPVPGYRGQAAVAVLPFVHLSDEIEGDYLADGITEDVITTLYTYRSIPVIARTSTFTYKSSSKKIPEIARELGAGYVVTGSIRVVGDKARISTQLVNSSGIQIWAENINLKREDLPAFADEISYRIAAAIIPEILSSEAAKLSSSPPKNMAAWDHYLRARSLAAEHYAFKTINGDPLTVEMHEQARFHLEKAIELEPNFAAAYSLLTHIDGTYVVMLHTQITKSERMAALDRAMDYAAKTQALSPFDASACSCQILLLLVKNEINRAVILAENALEVNPGNAVLIAGAAKAYQVAGQNAHALELIEKAKRLSPRDMSMATFLGFESLIHISLGDFEKAADVAERGILLDPDNLFSHLPRIIAHYALGQRQEASEALQEMDFHLGKIDPEIAWPWPEPVPVSLKEHLSPDMQKIAETGSLASLVEAIMTDLNNGKAS